MKTNEYVNTMRSLGIQAIQSAGQGHPGMAISAAPIIYAIYTTDFKMNWSQPRWIDRDRLILSAGHGCMALYPAIHLITTANHNHDPNADFLGIEELKAFRKSGSRTPGHPENLVNPWIETTTGPLGQGVAQGVGMAIAEAHLRAIGDPINHYTYVVVGDGDLQEGISYEAMSLAGCLKLDHLIVLHDSNAYQLESAVSDVNAENIRERVESMQWFYQKVDNDPKNIRRAIETAKAEHRPAFIEVQTIIGEGLPYEKSFEAHGGSIDDAAIESFRQYYDLGQVSFDVNEDIYEHFYQTVVVPGNQKYAEWEAHNPNGWNHLNNDTAIYNFLRDRTWTTDVATRIGMRDVLNTLNESRLIDDLFIISADLSKSTNVKLPEMPFNFNPKSTYLQAGVREFGIAGVEVGINLHGGLRAAMSTFLAFSDYMKAAIRLGAIARARGIYIFTHDSILIGSDGPTHQPVEQLAMLRTIPTVEVFRPCDTNEVAAAFYGAWTQENPTCIVLSRQKISVKAATNFAKTVADGGYLLSGTEQDPDFLILASGSEVPLASELGEVVPASVVYSVPNLNRFIKKNCLPKPKYGVVVIEASNDPTWFRLLPGVPKLMVGVEQFGHSRDGNELYEENGFTVPKILTRMEEFFHWKH